MPQPCMANCFHGACSFIWYGTRGGRMHAPWETKAWLAHSDNTQGLVSGLGFIQSFCWYRGFLHCWAVGVCVCVLLKVFILCDDITASSSFVYVHAPYAILPLRLPIKYPHIVHSNTRGTINKDGTMARLLNTLSDFEDVIPCQTCSRKIPPVSEQHSWTS